MQSKVLAVRSICFNIASGPGRWLVLSATGKASSSGWGAGVLVPWSYQRPPEDGFLDFDFLAEAPNGLVLWVMRSLSGEAQLSVPAWVAGVRVHAATNRIQSVFDDPSHICDLRTVGEFGLAGAP